VAAIGNYWAKTRRPEPFEVRLLQSLADSASIAMENVQLYGDLQASLSDARAARDEIARQLGLRDEFISVTAHELKTPLTPLVIQAQIIQKLVGQGEFEGHPRATEVRRFAEVTHRQATDLSQLIEELLEVSRIRLGHFEVRPTEGVEPAKIIEGLVEQFSLISPSRITAELTPGLRGTWDPLRLRQLLQNLLANAVAYGKGQPIAVRTSLRDGLARFEVEDEGIGVPEADRTRIFERFERATSIQSFGGMGLGLFICREIVRAHGGKIRVENTYTGRGARFVAELPL
jgi:signal transduction histidine kinase